MKETLNDLIELMKDIRFRCPETEEEQIQEIQRVADIVHDRRVRRFEQDSANCIQPMKTIVAYYLVAKQYPIEGEAKKRVLENFKRQIPKSHLSEIE